VPTGWDLTAADCGGTAAASNPPSFTLAAGATVTCSFTDTKRGTIIVQKQTIGGTGQFVFTGTGGSNLPASITLSTAAQSSYVGQTFTNVLPGTYTVSENGPPSGWDLTASSCTSGSPASFVVAAGGSVTCSFTDTLRGTIIVQKQTIGGTGSFVFTGTGGSNLPASITLSTAAQSTYVSQTFTNVLPGTYQVGETVPAGWDLTSADCGGTPAASNPAAFSVAPGASVTCRFTDTKESQIIVRKQTIGGTGQFVFTGTGGSNLPASITLSTAAQSTYVSQTFNNMIPGTYQVGENSPPSGWDLTSADCGGTPGASNPAAFTLAPGGVVTCSFTDTLRGTIIVVKNTVGGNGSFAFTNTGTGFSSGLTLTTTANTASQTFTNMLPGSYSVGETVPSGWDLTSSTCTSGAPAGFTLPAGGTVTCTFTDTKEGTIIVRKQTIGGTGQFVFTGTGGSTLPASITLSTAAQSTYVSQTFTNVLPGTYQVGETVPTGWDLTAADCGGTAAASNPAAFTVAAGATVTCSFTDTKRAHVTLLKTQNGVAPTTAYTFRLSGGPDNVSISRTTDGTNLGNLDFGLVKPGNYTLCELAVPAGTHSTLQDLGGTVDATSGDVCLNITLTAGEERSFTIDNTLPGGGQRTIGYWKNWNTCSHDGAFVARAAKTGNHLADEFLPQSVGSYVVTTCAQAVAILSKTPYGATKNAASNAAYNMAAQLLAAELNVAAGAATCGITTTIAQANALLTLIGFNGVDIPSMTQAQKQLALSLSSTLDAYNNGKLC
jgi:plastocyanin